MKNLCLIYAYASPSLLRGFETHGFRVVCASTPSVHHNEFYAQLKLCSQLKHLHLFEYFTEVLEFIQNNTHYEYRLSHFSVINSICSDAHIVRMAERQFFGQCSGRVLTDYIISSCEYWLSKLNYFDIDAVLFGEVPHQFFDYIFFRLLQHLGIPCLFRTTIFNKLGVWRKSINGSAIKFSIPSKDHSVYFERLVSTALSFSSALPIHQQHTSCHELKHKDFLKQMLLHQSPNPASCTLAVSYLKEIFDGTLSMPDCTSNDNILVLLNAEPEASIYPLANTMLTQDNLLKLLSEYFPTSNFFVREHPLIFNYLSKPLPWSDSPIPVYRNNIRSFIASSNRWSWSDHNLSLNECIRSSRRVVCMTGSSSLLAYLNNKEVVVADSSFLANSPNTYTLSKDGFSFTALPSTNSGFNPADYLNNLFSNFLTDLAIYDTESDISNNSNYFQPEHLTTLCHQLDSSA